MPGVLVRDPAWLARWASVVLGDLPLAPTPATIAWSTDLGYAAEELDPETTGIARRAADDLASRAGLVWADPAVTLADPRHAWATRRAPAASVTAQRVAATLTADNRRALDEVFEVCDLLATPTTPSRPHGHYGPGEHLSVALTWAFNLTGHPALSVPAGTTGDGAPVGLQLVGAPSTDAALLDLVVRYVPVATPADDGGHPC